MIRMKNLSKEYKNGRGLLDLTLEVEDGETLGLMGPFGSGKSTLIGILAGFLKPTRGICSINGKVPGANQEAICRFTGVLQPRMAFPRQMSAIDYLRFTAGIRGVKSLERGLAVLEHFGIDPELSLHRLPRGFRQMVGLAGVMLHGPVVLLLDEPDRYLDGMVQARFDELMLEEKARGTTILIASENFQDMERICDRMAFLRRGSLVNVDDVPSIRAARKKAYLVTFQNEMETLRFIRENPGSRQVSQSQVLLTVYGEILPCLKLLGNYQVSGFELLSQSLQEIFTHVYGGESHA
ncbi:MAG TPA: ABC transporter ATP-binding protein [Candidatus Limivivens intestinipullorum]|uniref:ABC transporter ATP-binding protein n=1 Tax=Candidatus Limivivens intestinipullorum TaxID=2840858 RepID=A0A9D1JK40_9FIRM|nr:ABC transporter ATP-binding protein [Candidatus Limivivens intestinipullorum]